MPAPSIAIGLEAIAGNTRAIARCCAAQGVKIFGVTKAACGSPLVARTMLRGGAVGLGRTRNPRR